MLLAPLLILMLWMTLEFYDGAIFHTVQAAARYDTMWSIGPKPTFEVHMTIASWMILQAILYKFLPGSFHTGQLTPAGNLLEYKTNGLLACFISCTLFGAAVVTGQMKASFIATHWGSFLAALNVWGMVVTAAAYAKARLAPTHPRDQVLSGKSSQIKHLLKLRNQATFFMTSTWVSN